MRRFSRAGRIMPQATTGTVVGIVPTYDMFLRSAHGGTNSNHHQRPAYKDGTSGRHSHKGHQQQQQQPPRHQRQASSSSSSSGPSSSAAQSSGDKLKECRQNLESAVKNYERLIATAQKVAAINAATAAQPASKEANTPAAIGSATQEDDAALAAIVGEPTEVKKTEEAVSPKAPELTTEQQFLVEFGKDLTSAAADLKLYRDETLEAAQGEATALNGGAASTLSPYLATTMIIGVIEGPPQLLRDEKEGLDFVRLSLSVPTSHWLRGQRVEVRCYGHIVMRYATQVLRSGDIVHCRGHLASYNERRGAASFAVIVNDVGCTLQMLLSATAMKHEAEDEKVRNTEHQM